MVESPCDYQMSAKGPANSPVLTIYIFQYDFGRLVARGIKPFYSFCLRRGSRNIVYTKAASIFQGKSISVFGGADIKAFP